MAIAQRGLGKGLEALFNNSNTSETPVPNDIIKVRPDHVLPNPFQPRQDFDEESLQELCESIAAQGVLQPILVRSISSLEEGQYELIAGERRLRASQMAGLPTIPAIVHNISDDESLIIAMIENLQREDLNAMDEAQGLQRLQDTLELSQDALAKKIGKSRPAVANSMRLLQLPEAAQDHVRHGNMSAGHARALLAITDAEAQNQLLERIIDFGISVRQAEALVTFWREHGALPDSDETLKKKPQKRADKRAVVIDPEFAALQKKITQSLDLKVALRGTKSKGQFVVSFTSEEQLSNLLEHLGIGV